MSSNSLLFVLGVGLVLSSCAGSSTIPLSKNVIQIQTNAAQACGSNGARKYALRQAAVETINRGYDKFIIVNAQSASAITGYNPTQSYTTGSATAYGGTAHGSASTVTTGGSPIYNYEQGLIVKMFKNGQPGSGNALSARQSLGPDWKKAITEKKLTCL